tara:strand:- start:1227 stop:2426 length:1200 start_codon:yes stop_codon:yes gene_type:complete
MAFGNALGNSIVGALKSASSDAKARQAEIEQREQYEKWKRYQATASGGVGDYGYDPSASGVPSHIADLTDADVLKARTEKLAVWRAEEAAQKEAATRQGRSNQKAADASPIPATSNAPVSQREPTTPSRFEVSQAAMPRQGAGERSLLAQLGESYDNFVGAWDLGKERTLRRLDEAAVSDGGGGITMAAAFLKFPAEFGFGLFDGGLALGGIIASPNYRGQQWDQLKDAWGDLTDFSTLYVDELVTDILSGEDDIRFSIDSKWNKDTVGGKIVIGTDFWGTQFKNSGTQGAVSGTLDTDQVVRYASDWEGNNVSATILEKTSGTLPFGDWLLPKSWKSFMSIDVAYGVRDNLTTSEARTAVNFKIRIKSLAFNVEWRGASHKIAVDTVDEGIKSKVDEE